MADYGGIRFSYENVKRDLVAIKQLSDSFLREDSKWALDACATDLENARNRSGNFSWAIPTDCPVRTKPSEEYRATDKGGIKEVYGELCFTWGIQNAGHGTKRHTHFHLTGIASTSILIKVCETDELVARWQFEAGDAGSPGCHFHSAVNQYGDGGLFPEWLKVPRLPGLLLLPMDGLEYLLGELFPISWHQHVSKASHVREVWSGSQRARLTSILSWQLKHVTEVDTTPWMTLKKAKPHVELLTEG